MTRRHAVLLAAAVLAACSEETAEDLDGGQCSEPLADFACPSTRDQALAAVTCGTGLRYVALAACENLELDVFSRIGANELWCYYGRTGKRTLVGAIKQADLPTYCGATSHTARAGDAPSYYYDCHTARAEKLVTCFPIDGAADGA